MCGLVIELEGDSIQAIRGDDNDPLSRGHICPKAVALQDLQDDPDWLKTPMRRDGDRWEPISWDAAFDEVSRRITAIRAEHGNDALGVYLGNPTVHNTGALLFGPPLWRALRTRNRYSATSVDQLPHHVVGRLLYGHQLAIPVPDIDRTDFLLLLGTNPLASNGSIMSVPDVKQRLQDVTARGGRVVLVDPRRTETAKLAEHHFIRPGTDALLLAAMVNTLFAQDRVSLGDVAGIVGGVEDVRSALAGFTAEVVAPIIGWTPEAISDLTIALADAPTAAVHGRMGVSTQEFGGLSIWLCQLLTILTGNLDRAGGLMFARPAIDVVAQTGRGRMGRWKTRVRELPEFGGELPVSALAEEITTPGPGQIRAMLTLAGNPVLSTPNGAGLDRALAGLDFMVSIDPYLNETTRHAHIILPPSGPLTRAHYDIVFHALAIRDTARYSKPLFKRADTQRHDWEILAELEARLGTDQSVKARIRRAVRKRMGPKAQLAIGLRMGPYGPGWLPWGGLTLGTLERAPSGVDLGPLKPQLPGRLFHKNKQIPLAPTEYLGDLPRLQKRLEAGRDEGLVLIGRRQLRSNNSWMHNSARLVKGKPRCTLLVHPEDAERLTLKAGGDVVVTSAVGSITAPIVVSDEVMPGVVSLPHGWGHGRQNTRLTVANEHAGVSINDLTDPAKLDTLTGNAVLNGVPVTIRPA
ncbi:MAG: anaerobic selenocysteine-containing dehydrogenase [Myxococcota bacterium]|jgi:anaerobic selenocysteine-containing dehydrogenase